MTKTEFERLREYIYRESGIYFEDSKVYYVKKRAEQQMEKYGFKDFTAYLGALRFDSTGKMRQELLNSLTVNETYFFREYDQLKCLAEEVIPLWYQNGAGRNGIRIWCAGCASGEEAYTLAIVMQEMAPDMPCEIHATDINTEVLDKAEKGIYNYYAVRHVPEVYFKRYFTPLGNNYAIVGGNIKMDKNGKIKLHSYGNNNGTNMVIKSPQLWETKIHTYGKENGTQEGLSRAIPEVKRSFLGGIAGDRGEGVGHDTYLLPRRDAHKPYCQRGGGGP